jgi:hypothetical protein
MAKFDYKVAFADEGSAKNKQGYELFRDTWMQNGFNDPLGEKVSWHDMISTPNARHWLPTVIEDIVREPVEPMLIVESLLDRVNYEPGVRITFPAIGALVAFDLAEGQAYPEQQLNVAPGTMTVTVGKSGLSFKISEEMRRHSQFDIINLHLRAARRALDRHKEAKGMRFISAMGVTLFDNVNPITSVYGTCTGRAIDGTGNGSCRMEDLLKAYAFIMMQGFTPNTLLMHPLTWAMWMADPLLQSIVKNTGNGQWFQPHKMPKSSRPWDKASQGGLGKSSANQWTPGGNAASATATSVASIDQNLQGGATVPGYFPYPLRVLVSPFVPFDPDRNIADIMIFDSSNLGALIVEEDVMVDEWEDKSVDIMKVKLRERYTFGIYHDGLAVGIIRNVPIVPNEITLPLQATIASSGSLSALDPTTAISGL